MASRQVLQPFDSLGDPSTPQPATASSPHSERLPNIQPEPLPAPADQTGESHLSLLLKFLGWFLVVPGIVAFLLNWLCNQLGW